MMILYKKESIVGPLQNPVGAKIRRRQPVSGVAKYKNAEYGQNLSLMSRIGLLKIPINPRLDPPFRQKSDLFVLGARLLTVPKNIKKTSWTKSKLSKKRTANEAKIKQEVPKVRQKVIGKTKNKFYEKPGTGRSPRTRRTQPGASLSRFVVNNC